MFKSEPKTIIQFLANHFDLLKQLFDIQVKNEIISRNDVLQTLNEFESDIESQLDEHKLLVKQNDDYVFNEPYFILFEFILQQFKPLLPEEIEKFGQSIRTLFLNIKEGSHEEKNILLDRIEALSNEIKKFTTAVMNNTFSLLNESRELKANTQKIDYQQKVQKARYLIEFYIMPLNNILDVNHNQSIYNELLSISKYSNSKRFDFSDESIRRQFEKLYHLLRQSEKDISQQSVILSNELLPLLDRIKTESEYLQGFHLYLTNGNCYKGIQPPGLLLNTRNNPYNPFIFENTREYFEQFKNEEDVIINEEGENVEQWIFNKGEYKSQLEAKLPVKDFFTWCKTSLEEDNEPFDFESFFMVTSLIFEEDYEIEKKQGNQNIILKSEEADLILPKLKIVKKEDVSE